MSVQDEAAFDLQQVIDHSPLGIFQKGVVVACGTVAAVDGFDTQIMGVVAPEIARSWNVGPASFGAVFSVGLLGGMIGGMGCGWISDRLGRKPTLLLALGFFGILSLATPFVTTPGQLCEVRFATGLGLGGVFPAIIALASEYSPRRLRTRVVGWMFCGFPLGAVAAGAIAAGVLPTAGWQTLFLIGGALPLALLVGLAAAMPESLLFLALRGNQAAIGRVLCRMGVRHAWNGRFAVTGAPSKSSILALLSEGRARGTLAIWATLFLSLLLVYFLINWLPLIARQTGFGLSASVFAVAALNLGTIVGSIGLGRFASARPGPVIGAAYLAGAAAISLIGHSGRSSSLLIASCFAAGVFATGAQICMIALGAAFYDTPLRATGVGWSMGVGRIGAVLGPFLGGLLVKASVSPQRLFFLTGLVSLCAAATALLAGKSVNNTDASQRRVT